MIRLFLMLLLLLPSIAFADNAYVVPSCGSVTLGSGTQDRTQDGSGQACVAASAAPSAASTVGIVPVTSASAENSHVLSAAPANLYSVYATNLTATPGYLVVLNLTAKPADGAILPLDCVPLPAYQTASINYSGPPARYGIGIVAVLSSATTCFTQTTGTITGFIKGAVK